MMPGNARGFFAKESQKVPQKKYRLSSEMIRGKGEKAG
jgi:hypothetical protein